MTNKWAELELKPEGVYINQYSFELPSNVLKVLIEAAEWYGYVIMFEGETIYLCSKHDKDYDKVYTAHKGLIRFLESWIGTFEDNISDYEGDEDELCLVTSYKNDCQILNDFILTLN